LLNELSANITNFSFQQYQKQDFRDKGDPCASQFAPSDQSCHKLPEMQNIYPLKKVTAKQFPLQHLNRAHTAKCKRAWKSNAARTPSFCTREIFGNLPNSPRKYSLFLTLRPAREISARPLPPHYFSTHRSSLKVPTHHPQQEPLRRRYG
jgi:hypothetical protein